MFRISVFTDKMFGSATEKRNAELYAELILKVLNFSENMYKIWLESHLWDFGADPKIID